MKNLLLRLGSGLLLGATACARPELAQPPPQLLPKPEMVRLLVEYHLLEARLSSSRLPPDSARALFLSLQRDLRWRYQLRAEDSAFERSYRYYAAHEQDLGDIYKQVLDSLSVRTRQLGGSPLPRRF